MYGVGTGRILKRFAGRQHGLLSDHAGPAHFFDVLQRVGDNPVAAEQLNGVRSLVGDANGVLKHPRALDLLENSRANTGTSPRLEFHW